MGSEARSAASPSTLHPTLGALCWSLGILALPVAIVLSVIDRGMDPNLAGTVAIAVATPLFAVAERWRPHTALWASSQGDLLTDAGYAVVITPVLGMVLLSGLSTLCLGVPAPPRLTAAGGPWPHHWPLLLQALLLGIGTDFLYYWWHRLCHRVPLLWRLHSIHHTVGRVYWLNAFRFHPLDSIIGYVVMYAPFLLLGVSLDVIAVYTVFDFLFGTLQHSNLAVRLGPLNWLLAGPELHRWHHSRSLEDGNNNYGNTWIVWDVVFGTRHLPREHDPADVGFPGFERYPKGLLGQLAAPFAKTL